MVRGGGSLARAVVLLGLAVAFCYRAGWFTVAVGAVVEMQPIGSRTIIRKIAHKLLGRRGVEDREIQERRRSIEGQTTDYRRWTDAKNYNPEWSPRSALAVEMIGEAKWICDLGCGTQSLRNHLAADCIYLPMDLKQWTDDTIVCDINQRSLPTDYLELCDFCFVMGVLEYVYDASWFLGALARSTEGIIISYNVAELSLDRREDNGWVNSLTSEQFKTLVESAGFKILDTRLYVNERLAKNGQLILKAINPRFDRLMRQEVRYRFLASPHH